MLDKLFGSVDETLKRNEILVKEPSVLESEGNRIFFYSDIGRESVLKLNKTLFEVANDHSITVSKYGYDRKELDVPRLYLHIYSYGGYINAGMAAMDMILNSTVPVYTVIDGACASAATFLSVVGKKRFIYKHGFILIHQASTFFWGKHEELKDEMANMEKFHETLKAIYKEHTKMPEDVLNEILKRDLWLDANEALKYGMVDEII